MKFILGTKQNMTQIFTDEGRAEPVTVISAGPVVVTQIKSNDRDGYTAVQVGFGSRRAKTASRATVAHSKKAGLAEGQAYAHFAEFKTPDSFEVGQVITASVFVPGDRVTATSVSKSKGFQGVVKLHGFAGGRRTHGQKHSEREPGSIGATGPQRVLGGTRMAGRMGGDRVTVPNLNVLKVDADSNILLVKGAIPGRRGTVVRIIAK